MKHRFLQILCCEGLLLAFFTLSSLKLPKINPKRVLPVGAARGLSKATNDRNDKDDDNTFWLFIFGPIAVYGIYSYFKDKNDDDK